MTADATACALTGGVPSEDNVELRDGATVLLRCCGTQCHKKTFSILPQAVQKTYTVVLTVQAKNTPAYERFGTTFPTLGVLPLYDRDLNQDVIRFQVSAQSTTTEESMNFDTFISFFYKFMICLLLQWVFSLFRYCSCRSHSV